MFTKEEQQALYSMSYDKVDAIYRVILSQLANPSLHPPSAEWARGFRRGVISTLYTMTNHAIDWNRLDQEGDMPNESNRFERSPILSALYDIKVRIAFRAA